MNNMSVDPLVSVIIPYFYEERYLEEALLSVFSQTYKNYEIIVVDDGSATGGAKSICKKYGDKLKYIRQENKGVSAARNNGIANSHGEYIAFLDEDDIWLPDKIEKQVGYFEELKRKNINAGLIYTGQQMIDEDNNVLANGLCKSSGYNYKLLLFGNFIGTPSCVMTTRSVLRDVGLFDEGLLQCQDFDMWIRIAKKYDIYSVNEILTRYRNRQNSLSKDTETRISNCNKIIEKQFEEDAKNEIISSELRKNLLLRYKKIAALHWKNAAYASLFQKKDTVAFRKFARKGYAIDKTFFDFKVWIYYILSFLSPQLCVKLRRLKGKQGIRNYVFDVSDSKYDWLNLIKGSFDR
ncbi:MAG: hypothetical protein A3C51_01670 [Omnitrophica bacterium RIFCSPHIGHO2_02_FULL_46_20]|nr:MAG: hypothetical protein A3C51_01670 [Omnitrophica bacterium RIFCSPHIGHO2_02_FULL_46_20]